MDGRRSVATVVRVLRGKPSPTVSGDNLDELTVFGLLEDHSRYQVVGMLEGLASERMIHRNDRGYYALTRWGRDTMTGEAPVWMSVATTVEKAAAAQPRAVG
jgi:superfamily II DNA helicase RecQ